MRPTRLREIIQKGKTRAFSKGEFFHSLDFSEELYVVKAGFAKRYSISDQNVRSIESIYGPNHFFPLTPVFKNLFDYDLGQENHTYVYQAITDIELHSISSQKLIKLVQEDPTLYADLLYETGRRLRVDIERLTSNALKTDYKKVVHQIVALAEEFGDMEPINIQIGVDLPLPLKPLDLAEQVNISEESAARAMSKLKQQGLIAVNKGLIRIPDIQLLRDAYLR